MYILKPNKYTRADYTVDELFHFLLVVWKKVRLEVWKTIHLPLNIINVTKLAKVTLDFVAWHLPSNLGGDGAIGRPGPHRRGLAGQM